MDQQYHWEDKYHNIRAERNNLAKKCNAQEQTIRVLRTRYSKLENKLVLLEREDDRRSHQSYNGSVSCNKNAFGGKLYVKEIDSINVLSEESDPSHVKLEKEYHTLQKKHKSALKAIAQYKKEINSLRRRKGYISSLRASTNTTTKTTGNKLCMNMKKNEITESLEESKKRITLIENQLRNQREENNDLRNKIVDVRNEWNTERESEMKNLNDMMTRHSILENKYSSLKLKAREQSDLNMELCNKLEDYHKMIKDLNCQLKKIQCINEKETSTAEKLRNDIQELTVQNRILEQKLISTNKTMFLEESASACQIEKLANYKVEMNQKENEINNLKAESNENRHNLCEAQHLINDLQKDKFETKQTLNRLEKMMSSINALGINMSPTKQHNCDHTLGANSPSKKISNDRHDDSSPYATKTKKDGISNQITVTNKFDSKLNCKEIQDSSARNTKYLNQIMLTSRKNLPANQYNS